MNEYYPPEYTQIDRILEIVSGDEKEDHIKAIKVDNLHGTNTGITVLWRYLTYSKATFEDIFDIQNLQISYIEQYKLHENNESIHNHTERNSIIPIMKPEAAILG